MGKKTRKELLRRLSAFASNCPWGTLNPCDPCNDKPAAKDKAAFVDTVFKLLGRGGGGGGRLPEPPAPGPQPPVTSADQIVEQASAATRNEVAVMIDRLKASGLEPDTAAQAKVMAKIPVGSTIDLDGYHEAASKNIMDKLGITNADDQDVIMVRKLCAYHQAMEASSDKSKPIDEQMAIREKLWEKTEPYGSIAKRLSLFLSPKVAVVAIHMLRHGYDWAPTENPIAENHSHFVSDERFDASKNFDEHCKAIFDKAYYEQGMPPEWAASLKDHCVTSDELLYLTKMQPRAR